MNSEIKPDQTPQPPSKWISYFLALNLAALVCLFIWEFTGPVMLSDDELREARERMENDVNLALEKNPPSVDYTGKTSGVINYVLDATKRNIWVHFSFAKSAVTLRSENIDSKSLDWDIAFRRAKIVTNGGDTNENGKAAVAMALSRTFESVVEAPGEDKFKTDIIAENPFEPKNPIIDKWYLYDFWTHKLKTKEEVYVIKTAKGRYVKFQILDYYCGIAAACYTVSYLYQGKETNRFPH